MDFRFFVLLMAIVVSIVAVIAFMIDFRSAKKCYEKREEQRLVRISDLVFLLEELEDSLDKLRVSLKEHQSNLVRIIPHTGLWMEIQKRIIDIKNKISGYEVELSAVKEQISSLEAEAM